MERNGICYMCSHFCNKSCLVEGIPEEEILYDDITKETIDCPMFNHYLDFGHLPSYWREFLVKRFTTVN